MKPMGIRIETGLPDHNDCRKRTIAGFRQAGIPAHVVATPHGRGERKSG